jgi:hypothetical protein
MTPRPNARRRPGYQLVREVIRGRHFAAGPPLEMWLTGAGVAIRLNLPAGTGGSVAFPAMLSNADAQGRWSWTQVAQKSDGTFGLTTFGGGVGLENGPAYELSGDRSDLSTLTPHVVFGRVVRLTDADTGKPVFLFPGGIQLPTIV